MIRAHHLMWGAVLASAGQPLAYAQAADPPPNPVLPGTLEDRVATLEKALAEANAARAAAETQALASIAEDPQTSQAEEPKLQLYGFMDAGLQKFFVRPDHLSGLLATSSTTFVSGHTNLYIDARPAPGWRGLVETRLTLYPQGYWDFKGIGPTNRVDTRIYDFSSPSGRESVEWGGIILERAQMEWLINDKLTLIVGRFLTPWGIWNVDHGTPTLISLMLPSFLVQETVPIRQTGVQALGSLHAPPWELGYRAFVSNGRTTTQFDLGEDKGLGGRIFLRRHGSTSWTFGVSGFTGRHQDESRSVVLGDKGEVRVNRDTLFALREWTAGADLSVDHGGFRLRLEGVTRLVQYDEGRHQALSFPGTRAPSRREGFAYGILAYRFSKIEPYAYVETGDSGARASFVADQGHGYSAGLNIHLSPATQLKTQVLQAHIINAAGTVDLTFLSTRLVMAF